MQKKLIFLFSLATITGFKAQNKAEDAIKIFEQKFPQEKIHLLVDKNNYIAGDNLWFKSFIFDGYSSSNRSTSLFIELYDKNKNQISKKLIPLFGGEGNGNITLPNDLKEGIYYIRAYTTWMSNFSDDFQLIKPIVVYNPNSPEKLVLDNTSEWTASVFPESGSFIQGINTKFAVRLNTQGVSPAYWSGYIIDKANPQYHISSFKNLDQNVATFNITPENNKNYQLILQDDKNKKQYVDLPSVSNSGLNLQVTNNTNEIKYTIKSSNISNITSYKILGTINNQVVYKARFNKLPDSSYTIPTDKLINGILQLTIFDDNENVIAQRLCFVEPELLKIKKPSVSTILLNNEPRRKSSFDIPQDSNQTNYTVAVIDAKADNPEDDQSFLSSLWLTGDITSQITKPAQYFKNHRNIEALDALLISEKWTRFNWQSIISGKYPTIKNNSGSYLSYKGTLTISGKPSPKKDLNIIFDDQNIGPKFYQVTTDNNGNFILDNVYFEDSTKFSYQLNTNQKAANKEVKVFFQPNYHFITYNKSFPLSSYKLEHRSSNEKPNYNINRLAENKKFQENINEKITNIEEIKLRTNKDHKTEILNNQLSSSLFKSTSEEIFDFINNNQRIDFNLLQWLQGRTSGLEIRQKNGEFIPYLLGNNGRNKADIYLNEVKINASQIINISPIDIAMVKIFKGYFAGSSTSNGAIAIYTKRGDILPTTNSKILNQIIVNNGYDKNILFNTPNYSLENFNNIKSDIRSVLYWNPSIETKSDESTNIKFYNNDVTKNYRVIIIGFDKNNDIPLYYNEIF